MFANPDAIRGLAGMLRVRAAEVRDEGDHLIARSLAVEWRGRAGNAMRVVVGDAVSEMRSAATRHDHAADVLLRHADAVEAAIRRVHEAAELADHLVGDAGHLLAHAWRSVA